MAVTASHTSVLQLKSLGAGEAGKVSCRRTPVAGLSACVNPKQIIRSDRKIISSHRIVLECKILGCTGKCEYPVSLNVTFFCQLLQYPF